MPLGHFDLYAGARKLVSGEDWKVDRFPDGQIRFGSNQPVSKVVCAVTCSEDLELFIQIGAKWNVQELRINYSYGSRSDKDDGHCNVDRMFWRLATVFYQFARISVLTPHGPGWQGYAAPIEPSPPWGEYDLIVFPDSSARARFIECDLPSAHEWHKERDQATGRILSHTGPEARGKRVLIVDDLCDGGATFVSMAPSFDSPDLYVTHGVFSKGLKPLADAGFMRVLTTNSYDRHMVSQQFSEAPLELVVEDVWETV